MFDYSTLPVRESSALFSGCRVFGRHWSPKGTGLSISGASGSGALNPVHVRAETRRANVQQQNNPPFDPRHCSSKNNNNNNSNNNNNNNNNNPTKHWTATRPSTHGPLESWPVGLRSNRKKKRALIWWRSLWKKKMQCVFGESAEASAPRKSLVRKAEAKWRGGQDNGTSYRRWKSRSAGDTTHWLRCPWTVRHTWGVSVSERGQWKATANHLTTPI